ncbi:gamma-glutamyltransferase family protein [Gordonia terrae]|uniref:Transferase n=2 Tax=Gordonia terrae TaxID=2055 RepID=A0AAD0NZM2_9ACTN|nr:gamma-glutamyltransferase [Gordonia terrae]ANY25590.1 transferase [Gordonia terrae]AWO86333.1 transferase [Gordonia terrae]
MTLASSTTRFRPPSPDVSRPTLRGWFGMAASTHWMATGAAQSVLERGGNAFDAAVAAGFVLHVVEPHLNGPGGDLVALIAPADRGRAEVVVGQGPAPRGASIEAFTAMGIPEVPAAGALAAAVPAAVESWLSILEEHGTWHLTEVLAYAADYARNGIPCSPKLAGVIETMAPHFREHWPTSAEVWLADRIPSEGDLIRNPSYASLLDELAVASSSTSRTEGIRRARELWRGPIARSIVAFASRPHRHSDGRDHAGVITEHDFAELTIAREEPLVRSFHGVEVVKAGFWSSGPVLLQALGILESAGRSRSIDPSTVEGIHTITEAMKLAMADRDAYYGDARDLPDTAVEYLLSPDYCAQRATLIADEASGDFRPGTVPGCRPFIPPVSEPQGVPTIGTGEPTVSRNGETRGDTCHVDVVDRWGNFVSATPSGGWLQSSPAIPGLGFCLGTRLQMTWLDPTSPSALTPGRRPRTTLSPTMLASAGTPVAALGTPGGDQQDQWQLLYLLRTVVGGYTPQEAIDAPMFHTTAITSSFWPRVRSERGLVIEDRVDPDVLDGLRERGHDVAVSSGWSLGRLSMVGRDPLSGILSGAANPRGGLGYAAGR